MLHQIESGIVILIAYSTRFVSSQILEKERYWSSTITLGRKSIRLYHTMAQHLSQREEGSYGSKISLVMPLFVLFYSWIPTLSQDSSGLEFWIRRGVDYWYYFHLFQNLTFVFSALAGRVASGDTYCPRYTKLDLIDT